MEVKKTKTKTNISLPQVVDAYQVSALAEAFADAVGRGKDISIKANEVTRMDTLGCQVLLSAYKAAQEEDVKFKLEDVSEDCLATLKFLGADKILLAEESK